MTHQEANLAAKMIEKTSTWSVGNVSYAIKREKDGEYGLSAWSPNSPGGAFHGTGIFSMLEEIFSVYVHWNEAEKRCEMSVF